MSDKERSVSEVGDSASLGSVSEALQASFQEGSVSPTPSHLSIKSDNSKGYPLNFNQEADSTEDNALLFHKRQDSPTSSSVSMQSDNSKGYPLNFSQENIPTEQSVRAVSPAPSCDSIKSDNSKGYPLNFKEEDVSTQQRHDSQHMEVPEDQVIEQIKYNLKKTLDESTQQNKTSCLDKVYTEVYIIEGGGKDVNCEHEVRLTERSFRRTAIQDTEIKCSDIFKPLPGQQKQIRTVLTNGIAGIGKTFTVQKFIKDWTENKTNEDIQLMVLLSFRELNLFQKKLLSLTELLQFFVKETQNIDSIFNFNVILILDGLDESRISLDFESSEKCCDVTALTSVDVLIKDLIRGNLLPSARLWITTRPAAARQIPPELIDQVTEIRGFSDPQKEEYFTKRISDENMAGRTITHLKSYRSLYIMCHIPVFCWIAAIVFEKLFSETHKEQLPKTLTELYTSFLITQTNIKKKYTEKKEMNEKIILKLGKLAFQQLEKGNLIFYEGDLKECGIEMKEALVFSGVCTQIFKNDSGLFQEMVFCFVHLTVQEYLAALYAHISFIKDNIIVFERQEPSHPSSPRSRGLNVFKLHKEAVDRAVMSQNGHWDLFLRFLMGFSQESNQNLLKTLLPQMRKTTRKGDTVKYIMQKIKDNPSPEKSINLFHCLNELSYPDLIEEVKNYLSSKFLSKIKLSPDQWAALVFILLTSEKDLDVFDLSQYMESNEAFQMLLPVVKEAKKVLIRKCNLTEKTCEMFADVLQSKSSMLKELDLSGSPLQLRQVKRLCSALGTQDCKLEKLKLNGCQLNEESCAEVVSAFSSNSASLKELDMTNNQLSPSVVKKLSETLKTQKCQLEVLRLRQCGVKPEGFRDLSSALQANLSYLKELDLSLNISGDAEAHALCQALNQPQCRLEILKLNKCELTHECCWSLLSIISSESSSLLELHLSDNKIQDAGVEKLAAGLEKAHCKLEVLKLYNCNISVKGCECLASALRLNPSHLRELYLNWNHPLDPGTNPLTELLKTRPPNLKLEKLDITPPHSVK